MIRTHAFGLGLRLNRPATGLEPAVLEGLPEVDVVIGDGAGADWPQGDIEMLVRAGPPDGRAMTIERDAAGAHRIHADTYGTTVISPDHRLIACAPASDGADARWQRLLIAHNLPFAAVLHGYEALHAGAVAIDGGVVAIVAASGTGKTSVARELMRGGARFVCDDVLVLDRELLAYPGAGAMNVRASGPNATEADENGEVRVRVDRVERPLPLRTVCFLERGPHIERFSVEAEHDAAPVLASTFNVTLRGEERLARHLDLSAAIARDVDLRRVLVPAGVDAPETAERILAAL